MGFECFGNALSLPTHDADRPLVIRHAFVLEWITIAWMTVEAAVGIWSGGTARSVSLVAFGLDSVIELVSAGVLVWRLAVEATRGQTISASTEKRASKIAGGLLFTLATYVVIGAAWGLWQHRGGDFSLAGLIVTAVAVPAMYLLSRAKLRAADALGSRALRADAIEAVACGWLSAVVMIGLIAELLFGAWWIDDVASLGIVWLLIREGREVWEGEDCCDD